MFGLFQIDIKFNRVTQFSWTWWEEWDEHLRKDGKRKSLILLFIPYWELESFFLSFQYPLRPVFICFLYTLTWIGKRINNLSFIWQFETICPIEFSTYYFFKADLTNNWRQSERTNKRVPIGMIWFFIDHYGVTLNN